MVRVAFVGVWLACGLARAGAIQVGAGETLVIDRPVTGTLGNAPIEIRHVGLVLVGHPIAVELRWMQDKPADTVEIELTGPRISEKLSVRPTVQRVVFRARPLVEGDYAVTVRAGGKQRRRSIEAVSNAAFANTPHVAGAGGYELVGRGIVKGKIAGVDVMIQRGMFEHAGRFLVVDVTSTTSDPATITKLVDALGTQETMVDRLVYTRPPGEVMWLARPANTNATLAVRVTTPKISDAERAVVGTYLATFKPVLLGKYAPKSRR